MEHLVLGKNTYSFENLSLLERLVEKQDAIIQHQREELNIYKSLQEQYKDIIGIQKKQIEKLSLEIAARNAFINIKAWGTIL